MADGDEVKIRRAVYDRLRDLVISFAESSLTNHEVENSRLRTALQRIASLDGDVDGKDAENMRSIAISALQPVRLTPSQVKAGGFQ